MSENKSDPLERRIKAFLLWYKAHEDGKILLDSGMMMTPGCSGDFGCCAKTYDFNALVDVLEELIK